MPEPPRTPPEPLDVDAVNVVAAGTAIWGALLVVCLVFYGRLSGDGRAWWMWTCLAGFLLGLVGAWYCVRRRNRLRERAR